MTNLRGPSWGTKDDPLCRWDGTPAGASCYHPGACGCQVIPEPTDDPEMPPAIPARFRPATVAGIWLTGAAAGWATAALTLTGA